MPGSVSSTLTIWLLSLFSLEKGKLEKGHQAVLFMLQLSLGHHQFGSVTIKHPSLHGSVIRVEPLSKAQEGEGGRELGSLSKPK